MVLVTIPKMRNHKVLPYREDGLFGLGRETERSVCSDMDFLVSPSASLVARATVAPTASDFPDHRFPGEEQDRMAIMKCWLG